MQYVSETLKDVDDQYALSISAAAMQMAKHPDAEQILAKLDSLAKQEGDRKWWSKEAEKKKEDSSMWYFVPRSNDVEITSYIVSALLDRESVESVLPIIKWLISQRNSNGGFSSTQDTVVGLEALIKFAKISGAGSGKMDIEFYAGEDDSKKEKLSVDALNSLVLQTHEVRYGLTVLLINYTFLWNYTQFKMAGTKFFELRRKYLKEGFFRKQEPTFQGKC